MPLNLVFTQAGTFTIDDNGIPGDGISVIRDINGVVIFTFAHPVDALGLTVNVPGVNLIINFTDTLGAADFSIGSLTDAAVTPDSVVMKSVRTTGSATLVSNTSIIEGGNDYAADIVAGDLILSAQTGVGTAANAMETQTSFIEAETVTGGISLKNIGSVQIGGITDLVNGLDVLTSGNLTFTVLGSIFLSDLDLDAGTNPPNPPAQSVHGGDTSGNVTLTAQGFLSDIFTNTDTDAVSAPRGNVTLTAGRDIAIGTIGVDFDNDIRANGTLLINAGRDFLLDGFSDVSSDDFFNDTGGNLVINTGRNIHVRDIAGSDATITASGSAGADVIFTTGFSGAVILDAPSATAVSSSSGNVIVSADRMLIGSTSGITANSGTVILQPATAGRAMFLGSASDAALAVELANSELDRIFTPNLQIGSTSTGLIRVIAPFSPANAPTVDIRSGSDIYLESSFSVINDLTLRAGNNLYQFGATLVTAGGNFRVFVDEAQDDGATGGVGLLSGAVTATLVRIDGNIEADTLTGTEGNDTLAGLGGVDTLRGQGGNNSLDGGTGNDIMIGGLGDDVFTADSAGDTITEAVGEGTDTVQSSVTLTLSANVERLTLTGSANINGTGNTLDNLIFGNTGNNALNGGAGANSLRGGVGDDTYTVDNVADGIVEIAAQGTDTVNSSVTFALSSNVENLTLTGAGVIDGTGNTLANVINGNVAANILNGGVGADTMAGSVGNDTYIVDNAGDVVTENAASGTDLVESSVTFTLGANVENLTLTGLVAINGTGNTLANVIHGNGGANTLSGGDGADDLFGGAGNDNLNGGTGADKYRFDTILNAAGNVDDILDFSVVDDSIFLDRDIFTGILVNGTLAATAFRAGTAAVDADDRIIYDAITGNIFYDADGLGGAAQTLFATVTPLTLLTNADFTAYI